MTNNPVADLVAELPEWHRYENPWSILLYTLKQDGWRKGEPVMVNDLMIRIENAPGSNHDLGLIADKLLAALTPASAEPVAVRHTFDGYGWLYNGQGDGSDWLARALARPDAQPLYSHPTPVTVEAADHPAISIGNIGNYYGGLILKREGGIDYWAIENFDGDDWEECDPHVASALRALSGEKS